jgi:RNA polymerase sigma factor (sigma-70 family)
MSRFEPARRQVFAYLEQMTKHNALDAQRRRAAKKRGTGTVAGRGELDEVPSRDMSVSDDFTLQEEIHLTSAKLSGSERTICMYRIDKYSWKEIGDLKRISAAAVQKRYERALNRISRERRSR